MTIPSFPARTLVIGAVVGLTGSFAVTYLPPFDQFTLGRLAVLIMVTVSLNYLLGVCGLISLASPAFLGFGGYGVILAVTEFSLPLPWAAMVTVIVAAVIGLLLGLVALRLRDFYLAIITLGFLQVLSVLFRRGGDLFGSGYGLVAPPITDFGNLALTEGNFVQIGVFLACLVVAATYAMSTGRLGRALHAVKDHEVAAELQGINLRNMRGVAFAFSSAVAALAGCVDAFLIGSTNPASYTVEEAIWHLAIVVVGGIQGSIAGAILAASVLFLVPESVTELAGIKEYVTGGVLLLFLLAAPRGIGGMIESVRGLARRGRTTVAGWTRGRIA